MLRVRGRRRNCSLGRKAQGIGGYLRVGGSFGRPAQGRGGLVSCSKVVHVDQRKVVGLCPGRDLVRVDHVGASGSGIRISSCRKPARVDLTR